MGMKKEHQELVDKYTLGNPRLKARIEARVANLMKSKGLYQGGVINANTGVSVGGGTDEESIYNPFGDDGSAQGAVDAQKEYDDYFKSLNLVDSGMLVDENSEQKVKDAFGVGNPLYLTPPVIGGNILDNLIDLRKNATTTKSNVTELSTINQTQKDLTDTRSAIQNFGEVKYPPAEGEEDTRTDEEIATFKSFQDLQKKETDLVGKLGVDEQNLATSGVPSGTEVSAAMASDPMSFVPEQTVVKLGDQSADDLESQTVDSGLAKSTDLNITKLITDSGVAGVSWNAAKKKFVTSEKEYTPAELASEAGLDLNKYYSETDAGTSKAITSNAVEVPGGEPLTSEQYANIALNLSQGMDDLGNQIQEGAEYDPRFDADGDGVITVEDSAAILNGSFTVKPLPKDGVAKYKAVTTATSVDTKLAGLSAPIGPRKPKLDAEGNPVLDAEGNPVMESSFGPSKSITAAIGPRKPKLDAEGNPVLDAEGNPVMELTTAVSGLEAAKITDITTVAKTADMILTEADKMKAAKLSDVLPPIRQLNEKGEPVLDANGEPIMVPNYPKAIEVVTNKTFNITAASFKTPTPEATAATDYDLGESKYATRTVDAKKELATAQGLGLSPEQSKEVVSNHTSDLEAAKGKVEDGETIDPEDTYSLSVPETSSITLPETPDPAIDKDFPDAKGAETDYQSNIEGAKGKVGEEELINADNIGVNKELVNSAVYTTAKIMEELNANAVLRAPTLEQITLQESIQGVVKPSSTVRGQMNIIMQEFNDGTPAWAASAMRATAALMASRGMGASSMAASAMLQASLESALPIAERDARIFSEMDMSNLTDARAVALSNAAALQGLELQNLSNQNKEAIQNSTNAFSLQSDNLSNMNEVVLANFTVKAALQNKSLDLNAQVAITNASTYADMKELNLSNEQQSLLQQSAENLQIELSELNNDQQSAIASLQVKAAMMGQNLTNEQQMAVLEATNAYSAAEFDASAKNKAFLQDAISRAALEGKSMDIRQQTALFNAARIAEVNDTNLTYEQQVNLQKSTEALNIEIENLNSREATALANAQLRAALQGKVLDNKQQVEILNTERYASANDITLTNKQQAFVQEYAARTAMEGKVIDNKQQTEIFNVANELQERKITLETEQSTLIYNMTNDLTVETTNLSSRVQASLANAQIEAALVGQELSNAQQEAVINSERIAEVANLNFAKDQSEAMQDSKLAQTANLANLSNEQALIMAEAAQLSSLETTELNNRQQAEVQNANNFLQLDLANLDNEQQTQIFKAQQQVTALFTDAAAENAALNFNAASENQTNQFFADLASNASKFNLEQQNIIKSLDLTEANSNLKFNASLKAAREQYETSNALIIEQANSTWRQEIATIDTAEQNDANATAVSIAVGITSAVIDQIWQKERDDMDYAFTASESGLDRITQILVAKLQGQTELDAINLAQDLKDDASLGQALFDWALGR
jgi:hypothetical protein